jgi:hypothetical protein
MKKFICICSIVLIFFLNGCLTYHVVEFTIDYNDDFNSGYLTVSYSDIRSSETDTLKQQKDFEELIELYKGDIFLLDQVDEGLYVKERKLYEKNGKLYGSYSGIFQKLKIDDGGLQTRNDERYILIDIGPDMELESNGKVYRSDYNALVVWPTDQKKLKIRKIVKDYDNVGYSILENFKKWKE